VPLTARRGRGRARTGLGGPRLRGRARLRGRTRLGGRTGLLRRRDRGGRLLRSGPVVLREWHRHGRRGRGRPGCLGGRADRLGLRRRLCRRGRFSLAVRGAPSRGRRLRHGPIGRLRLRCLLRCECFLEPSHDGRLDRRGRRPDELTHFLELGHHGLALDPELLREFVHPNLRHCAPFTWPGCPDPRTDRGSACSGRRQLVLFIAAYSSGAHRNLSLLPSRRFLSSAPHAASPDVPQGIPRACRPAEPPAGEEPAETPVGAGLAPSIPDLDADTHPGQAAARQHQERSRRLLPPRG
jgi:hypothetical protein